MPICIVDSPTFAFGFSFSRSSPRSRLLGRQPGVPASKAASQRSTAIRDGWCSRQASAAVIIPLRTASQTRVLTA
jgi:hypothetical protein